MSFAQAFVLYASWGTRTHRHVAGSLAEALEWKASRELDGYRVSEPCRYEPGRDGNVVELGLRAPSGTRGKDTA